ncbi:MAG: acyl-CoA thioesterase [Burkholderiales bacterium]|nr:acyl-CoA thioesterase [Anaerolineae bacterium]
MAPTDQYVAETIIRVRYAETDAMGIVHHASYIIYLEEARTNYARVRGSDYASFESSGFYLTVTEVNARYIKPTRYGQRVIVRCWISDMKSRGLTFNYEIIEEESGDLLVSAYSKHICITHEGQVARLPDSWRNWGGN